MLVLFLLAAVFSCLPAARASGQDSKSQFIDLSLLVAPELPCKWPVGFPPFQISHYQQIGPRSAYNCDMIIIDENTGTQFDAPTHSVTPADSGLPSAGEFGWMSCDKVPAWQFGGEACVVDCKDLLDKAPLGRSALVTKQNVIAWEKSHRPVGPGDVVLFHSGYSDKFYKPFPDGRRFIADALEAKVSGWPDPDPDCMEYLASRKVMTLGTDSPSMGPIPDLAEPTHFAGLKHGMIWTEGATGLDQLPPTGAFYCMIAPKTVGGIGGSGRAFAIVDTKLAQRLIESTRKKTVADLSVTLAEDLPVWWPGAGVGNSRYPYYSHVVRPFNQQLHTLDSHAGTHLVPPAYALPPTGFDNRSYSADVQHWLAEYEKKYGPRGTSEVTTERVPLSQSCGWARIIDVTHLIGTTDKKSWPQSPEITPAEIRKFEDQHGELKPGEVVIFSSGWSDRYLKPFPEGDACMADPLNGKSEGWPAPGPDAVMYLAKRGIRCVATDGPTLGGAEPKRALATYWALGTKGMVGVEFLTNLESLQGHQPYFIFAAIKIRDCHGGPGRAIALY